MACNEPDTLYSITGTYLDIFVLYSKSHSCQTADLEASDYKPRNHVRISFFSSVWTFKFYNFDIFFFISISMLLNRVLGTKFDSIASQIKIILLSETTVSYEILIHNLQGSTTVLVEGIQGYRSHETLAPKLIFLVSGLSMPQFYNLEERGKKMPALTIFQCYFENKNEMDMKGH